MALLIRAPTTIDYIGFDIHKKTISFCAKAEDGTIRGEGVIRARRDDLDRWIKGRPRPWVGAMEGIEDLKVAHPPMLKAIAASKKKNDRVDARKIADLLRCDLLPECYMAPSWIRDLRRVLRYRNLVVRQATQTKNRVAGLLMETGTEYSKGRLHGKRYFQDLLGSLQETPDSVVELLKLSRRELNFFESMQRTLVKTLESNPRLRERIKRLESIPGVGEIVA